LLHREDGPAVECEYEGGFREWHLNGNCHREDGPAVERDDGSYEWWLNDIRHRANGPAVEWIDNWGMKVREWFLNGKHHRVDGPAMEHTRYQLEDKNYSEEDYWKEINKVRKMNSLERSLDEREWVRNWKE
jgi:hypothetical protein